MPDTDIVSAARRVATRFEAAKRNGHTDVALRMEEAIPLLPFLNAVAARHDDAGRVERWARAMCAGDGADPDRRDQPGAPWWTGYIGRAKQAIAISNAEKAVSLAKGWSAYEEARDVLGAVAYHDGAQPAGGHSILPEVFVRLDAAVRRLAMMEKTDA